MSKTDKKSDKSIISKEVEVRPYFKFDVFLSKSIIIPYIILFVIFIADIADGSLDDGVLDTNFYVITAILLTLLSIGTFGFLKFKARKTIYTFSKDGISYKSEFPWLNRLEIKYPDINKIIVRQRYIQKKYGIGNIILEPKSGTEKITLSNVDKVAEVEALINKMLTKFHV